MKTLNKNDLVHAELSYKIIGCAYEGGRLEKFYQKVMDIDQVNNYQTIKNTTHDYFKKCYQHQS